MFTRDFDLSSLAPFKVYYYNHNSWLLLPTSLVITSDKIMQLGFIISRENFKPILQRSSSSDTFEQIRCRLGT